MGTKNRYIFTYLVYELEGFAFINTIYIPDFCLFLRRPPHIFTFLIFQPCFSQPDAVKMKEYPEYLPLFHWIRDRHVLLWVCLTRHNLLYHRRRLEPA